MLVCVSMQAMAVDESAPQETGTVAAKSVPDWEACQHWSLLLHQGYGLQCPSCLWHADLFCWPKQATPAANMQTKHQAELPG